MCLTNAKNIFPRNSDLVSGLWFFDLVIQQSACGKPLHPKQAPHPFMDEHPGYGDHPLIPHRPQDVTFWMLERLMGISSHFQLLVPFPLRGSVTLLVHSTYIWRPSHKKSKSPWSTAKGMLRADLAPMGTIQQGYHPCSRSAGCWLLGRLCVYTCNCTQYLTITRVFFPIKHL